MTVHTIPPGVPFARALATGLWAEAQGAPERLAAYTVLLPTRRACRVVRAALVRLAEGGACLLPRLIALADIEDAAPALAVPDPALPPAAPPLWRRLTLVRLILAQGQAFRPALSAAAALEQFMDEMAREEADWAALDTLVPEDFAAQWGMTLAFLKIVREAWPAVLAEAGFVEPEGRAAKALDTLAQRWVERPPPGPVVAAGSTGSHPAVARLLAAIARMPGGRVVLPGLDAAEDWADIGPTHPSWGLKHLLAAMGVAREEVRPWPCAEEAAPRLALLRAMMGGPGAGAFGPEALCGLRLLACAGPEEEALVIALLLRWALETPGKTAMVVTADRGLAARVGAAMARWGVTLDDSAGTPLPATPAGGLLALTARVAVAPTRAETLALLRHPLCGVSGAGALEHAWRRGEEAAPPEDLVAALRPLEGGPRPLAQWLETHTAAAEALAGAECLWRGADGRAAARLFADTLRDAEAGPLSLTGAQYTDLIEALAAEVAVRPPAHRSHPRLQILSPLEARLMDADLVVLAGLNEGSWPREASPSPWLSRPMRAALALPPAERLIGLAAHDFAQHFAAAGAELVLTRARREDGVPTVPARWLTRMDAALEAAGVPLTEDLAPATWAAALDQPAEVRPARRPAPRPPAHARPRRVSVTRVEEWLHNPYAVYARYVLDLRALDTLEIQSDPRAFGTALHALMEAFVQDGPPTEARFVALAHDAKGPAFWAARFARLAPWAAAQEQHWRAAGASPWLLEQPGEIRLSGGFALTGKPDRVDRVPGGAAVLDYKTGGTFSAKKLHSAALPQLPLEAAMVRAGAFPGIPAGTEVHALAYWVLSGGREAGRVVRIEGQAVAESAQAALEGLTHLVEVFADEDAPFLARPRPAFAPRFDDYAHLARTAEWSGG
ncbi:MAG: PD-(D/E)XK nuclease family protein [Alphaproteobacteria bacterium]|jgi:ATP-dependent helicase/nuclease subunit B|nr:PD-(D/E)XK nuclease family protein [Alphaproteobacteria bacterium]